MDVRLNLAEKLLTPSLRTSRVRFVERRVSRIWPASIRALSGNGGPKTQALSADWLRRLKPVMLGEEVLLLGLSRAAVSR